MILQLSDDALQGTLVALATAVKYAVQNAYTEQNSTNYADFAFKSVIKCTNDISIADTVRTIVEALECETILEIVSQENV